MVVVVVVVVVDEVVVFTVVVVAIDVVVVVVVVVVLGILDMVVVVVVVVLRFRIANVDVELSFVLLYFVRFLLRRQPNWLTLYGSPFLFDHLRSLQYTVRGVSLFLPLPHLIRHALSLSLF